MISVKYANDDHMDEPEPTSEPSGGHGLKSVVEVNSDVFVGDKKFVELRNTVHETTRLRNFSTRRDDETARERRMLRQRECLTREKSKFNRQSGEKQSK